MSNLTNYEISIWDDEFQTDTEGFVEKRRMVIGASSLLTQSRALRPNFRRCVNGTKELSFEMYYRYIDITTGEEVENPFVKHLSNETKIKLKKDDKWYNFIIKDIQEDSVNKLFKYQATDLHSNELSKNGYGLTIAVEKGNNIDTVGVLGNRIFEGTDWKVESEKIPQKTTENLIEIKFNNKYTLKEVYQLKDDTTVAPEEVESTIDILSGQSIYVFYSTLKDGKDRFQFIYTGNAEIVKNGDRIIQNKNCQYYIDKVEYSTSNEDLNKIGLKTPSFLTNLDIEVKVSSEFCGDRYVYSHKTVYNSVLDKYVTEYHDNEGVTWCEFTETKYESPILISNLISNTDFKTATGWTGQYIAEKESDENKLSTYGATREVATSPDITSAILDGNYNPEEEYTPYLKATFSDKKSILINSGIFDNRKKIKNFSPQQKFILMWRLLGAEDDTDALTNFLEHYDVYIANYSYSVDGNCYSKVNGTKIAEASKAALIQINNLKYCYANLVINKDYCLTEQEFLADKFQLFIQAKETGKSVLELVDLQLFEYIPSGLSDIPFIYPDSQSIDAKIITEYYYFNPNTEANKKAVSKENMELFKSLEKKTDLKPSYLKGAEKIVTISVKQSNYFNAAQALAEAAQCWVEFDVQHNDDGTIKEKIVRFKNYIGQNNYAGFRYGVNLNSIQRTNSSKSIVTKLLVQDVTNEHANNGFCTIARAGSNETGETFIYDFNHYIRQKQLDYNILWDELYNISKAKGPDIQPDWKENNERNIKGYYIRLQSLNKKIDDLNTILSSHSLSLLQAQSDLQLAVAGETKAAEEHESAAIDFLKTAGFAYNEIKGERKDKVQNSPELSKALQKIATYEAAHTNYTKQRIAAEEAIKKYENLTNTYNDSLEVLKEQKTYLNNSFETKYRRFIQEGTWTKQESIDDEWYYLQAKSVAYTSAVPQVTYSISVTSLSEVEGYENFKYSLADKTWIEDEEFFGYDEKGYPYREEVVLSEINEQLDEPDKTTFKIQNFKNQFQDLFQRIAASVQTVNYASPAWNAAGSFINASNQAKTSFLTDALNNAEFTLRNAGEQSVETGSEGIIVTDLSSPDQKIRIIGGAIMLGGIDDNGQEKWDVGMTAAGISAKIITSGRLNTGEVVIMNGDQPTFRWDSFGISAYDAGWYSVEDDELIGAINTKKFVRFDKNGIYGINDVIGIDGASWHPHDTKEIDQNATFALTWEGLKVTGDDGVVARIGKQNDDIFNVTKTTNDESTTTFKIKKDGSVETTGKIITQAGEIAGWNINRDSIFKGDALIYSGDEEEYKYDSLFTSGKSPIRFGAGKQEEREQQENFDFILDDEYQSGIEESDSNGELFYVHKLSIDYAQLSQIPIRLEKFSAEFLYPNTDPADNCYIDKYEMDNENNKIVFSAVTPESNGYIIKITLFYYFNGDKNFAVLEDGSMYATGAKIAGDVEAKTLSTAPIYDYPENIDITLKRLTKVNFSNSQATYTLSLKYTSDLQAFWEAYQNKGGEVNISIYQSPDGYKISVVNKNIKLSQNNNQLHIQIPLQISLKGEEQKTINGLFDVGILLNLVASTVVSEQPSFSTDENGQVKFQVGQLGCWELDNFGLHGSSYDPNGNLYTISLTPNGISAKPNTNGNSYNFSWFDLFNSLPASTNLAMIAEASLEEEI